METRCYDRKSSFHHGEEQSNRSGGRKKWERWAGEILLPPALSPGREYLGGVGRREEQLPQSFILQVNFSHLQRLSAILGHCPNTPDDSPEPLLTDSVMARNTLSKHQLVAHLLQLC